MINQSPQEVIEALVRKFKALPAARRKDFNEENTRKDFILPLFAALEWNTADADEVAAEEKVSRGWVDFSFRIHGIPRFFLETKRLREDLDKPDNIAQAIDYSWAKNVVWALLSNFERLRVFNAEWKEGDPQRALFLEFTVDNYLSDFAQLWWLSRSQIITGILDREAEKFGKKAHKQPVSQHLFDDLKEWRQELFRHLKAYNKGFSEGQIDEAVLRIMNRLIFIRTAEDRQIERPLLRPLVRELETSHRIGTLPSELAKLFRELDGVYDSDLFAEHYSEKLDCEPQPFQLLIEGLYQKRGTYVRYNFNAIDADVLGTAYEQYLGHVMSGAKAPEVIEKRAKRKAEGIFYTPTFISRYIVRQTLGRLLQEVPFRASKPPRVLDLACGSGSFLTEAFDVLDRHLAGQTIQTRLTSTTSSLSSSGDPINDEPHDYARRLQLLSASIFGVDKDEQAVSVTKLNLSLRAVQRREKLPMLDNIRCGDSLISGTSSELQNAFGADWRSKKPFDWEEAFPAVFHEGGFDVIVGNPPYVRIQTLPKDEVAYYNTRYSAATGNYDIYVLFVERAFKLLKAGGTLGFILPSKFISSDYGEGLRKLISEAACLWKIVDFEDAQVFADATTYTCLLFLQKRRAPTATYLQAGIALKQLGAACLLDETALNRTELQLSMLTSAPWILSNSRDSELLAKIREAGPELGTLTSSVFQGLRTSANQIYVLDKAEDAGGPTIKLRSKALGKTVTLERALLWPFLRGEDIKAYSIAPPTKFILVPYAIHQGEASLIPPNELEARFPLIWKYLLSNRAELESRESGKMRHDHWYAYVYPKNLVQFASPKIITPDIAPRAAFALDADGRYSFVSGYGITLKPDVPYDMRYILALLNSPPLDFYLKRISTRLQQGFFRYFSQYIERLPIPQLNLNESSERSLHDNVVNLVQQMIDVHNAHLLAEKALEDERHPLSKRIVEIEHAINDHILPLFGLSSDDLPAE